MSEYCKLVSRVSKGWFQSKYRVSNTWIPLADLGIPCHIDLKSYRLKFVKSKSESTRLDFYSDTGQNKTDQVGTKK